MTITSDVHTAVAPSGRADRIGRGLAAFASLATVGAFADGIIRMTDAADDRLWVEAWRTITYAFFIGLFALLAARPRQAAGIWELALAGKTALVVFAVIVGDIPEARLAGMVDFALVVVVALAYVLTRGWQAWHLGTTDPPQGTRRLPPEGRHHRPRQSFSPRSPDRSSTALALGAREKQTRAPVGCPSSPELAGLVVAGGLLDDDVQAVEGVDEGDDGTPGRRAAPRRSAWRRSPTPRP